MVGRDHGYVSNFCSGNYHPVSGIAVMFFQFTRKKHRFVGNGQRCQEIFLANLGKPFPWRQSEFQFPLSILV